MLEIDAAPHAVLSAPPLAAGAFEPYTVTPTAADLLSRLLERFADLARTFSLPALDDLARPSVAREEVLALAAQERGEECWVACLSVCVLRCSSGDPVFGGERWADSCLLNWASSGTDDAAGDPRAARFGAAVASGAAGTPRIVTGTWPGEGFVALLRHHAPAYHVQCDDLPGGGRRLSFAPAAQLFADAGTAAVYLVEILPSALVRALGVAESWVERLDLQPDEELPDGDVDVARWLPLLPGLAPWERAAPATGGVEELMAYWNAAAPPLPPDSDRAPQQGAMAGAGRVRAEVSRRFAALASRCPTAAWVALLSAGEAAHQRTVARAARAAGVALLPPNVQSSAVEWEIDGAAAVGGVPRCGLGSVLADVGSSCDAPLAPQIVQVRATGGPYSSVFDLVRRVPALAEAPEAVARLICADACADLHERSLLLAQWEAIARWVAAEQHTASIPEPELTDGQRLPVEQLNRWISILWPLAPLWEVLHTPPPAAAVRLPADLRSAMAVTVPADPAPQPVAGVVRDCRRLEADDGDQLLVIELVDMTAAIPVVIAPYELALEPESARGSWLALPGVVLRSEAGLALSTAVLAPRPAREVQIAVPRLLDRDADLTRLLQLRDLLDRHPGAQPVQVVLVHAGFRRALHLGSVQSVRWSPHLREAVLALLGSEASCALVEKSS